MSVIACSFFSFSAWGQRPQENRFLEVANGQNGDRVYVQLDSIKKRNRYGENKVYFSQITLYGQMQLNKSIKSSSSYTADCNNQTLTLHRYATYDASNKLLFNVYYGTPSTPNPPTQKVATDTVGYASWQYVCKQSNEGRR